MPASAAIRALDYRTSAGGRMSRITDGGHQMDGPVNYNFLFGFKGSRLLSPWNLTYDRLGSLECFWPVDLGFRGLR
jgi:hypothetical protein